MPPADQAAATATATPRHEPDLPHARPRPRRVPARPPLERVRWDRVGRVALLVVLAVVAALYVEHAIAYVSARRQADAQLAVVNRLREQNAALARQQRSLNDPATIVRDARALGMVWQGERPYVITGMPSH